MKSFRDGCIHLATVLVVGALTAEGQFRQSHRPVVTGIKVTAEELPATDAKPTSQKKITAQQLQGAKNQWAMLRNMTAKDSLNLLQETVWGMPRNVRGALSVLGGVMIHICLGSLYCWGNFVTYLPKAMKYIDGKDHPGVQPDAMMMIPVSLITQMMGNFLSAYLQQKWYKNVELVSLLGAWTMAGSVLISSFMKRLLPFALFYGLIFGFSIGTAYSSPMLAGWTWFPNQRGLVNGLILAGFGSGAFIFNQIGTKFANPKNLAPDQADLYSKNFAGMLRKLAGIYMLISGAGCALVQKSPEALQATAAAATSTFAETMQNVKTSEFWLTWVSLVLISTGGLNAINFHKVFGIDQGVPLSDVWFSRLGALGALFNGLGRVFWAAMVDYFGFKGPWTAMSGIMAVSLLSYKWAAKSWIAFYIITPLIFGCQGGAFAMAPTIAAGAFGPIAGAQVFAYMWSAFAVAGVAGPPLTRLMSKLGGWVLAWSVLGVGALISAGLPWAVQTDTAAVAAAGAPPK